MDFTFFDYTKLFVITLVIFLAIDMLWLGWAAKDIYKKSLKKLLTDKPNLPIAGLFYFVYVFGLVFFAIAPALRLEDPTVAAINGALFGLIAYATYDLTNYATLKNWPRNIVILDLIWGTVLSFSVSIICYNLFMALG